MRGFIFFVFIYWGLSLNAQQFKIDFSSPGSIRNNSATTFHRYGTKLYSHKVNYPKAQFAFSVNLKKVKHGLELIQYDGELKELKTISLDNEEKDFGPFNSIVHYGETEIYVLYSKFANEDKIKMYVSKVNPENLSVTATKEIMEHDQKNQAFWGAVKTIENTQVFCSVSKDGKNMWIVQSSPTLILSTVIDGDLNIIQKLESLPGKMEKLLVTGAHIGNDGNKVLVCRYDNPAKKEFFTRAVFFQPANSKGLFKTIKFPDGFSLGNLTVKESIDGKKLYFGGEYFAEKYAQGGQGVLLGEINIQTQDISDPTIHPYTDELKQRVLDLDFASKKKGEIVFTDRSLNYYINEMENGTVVLSADMNTSASTTNYTFYYKGPIIHVFIKPGGKCSMTLIPKKQASGSVTEFYNYIYKDKIICIYADIPKFQKKEFKDKQIGLVRRVVEMVPVANVYDAEGRLLERKMLVDSPKKMKGNVMIGNRSRIENNKFVFPVGESKVNMARYYTKINQFCYLEIL